MRLSIIVTVFNTADYLAACVRSVLDQASPDAELILIDDGSTDTSWAVSQRLAAADGRVRLAQQPNQGPSAARNHGLALATGDYVTFIDSDDTLTPGTLDRCAALLDAQQPDILIYSMQHYTEASRTGNDLVVADTVYASAGPLIEDLLAGQRLLLYSAANKFYRHRFLRQHTIQFPLTMDFGEDRWFNNACLRHAGAIVTCSHIGYRYHLRSRPSLSRKYRRDHFRTLLALHQDKKELIDRFARHHPARDSYLALDLMWEIITACDHLRQHWKNLAIAERYREVRQLCLADRPAYFAQAPCPTLSRKLLRFALQHRLPPILYPILACGADR